MAYEEGIAQSPASPRIVEMNLAIEKLKHRSNAGAETVGSAEPSMSMPVTDSADPGPVMTEGEKPDRG